MSKENAVKTVSAVVGPNRHGDAVVLRYSDVRLLGNGTFGVVYRAKLADTDQLIAIKKVLQNRAIKNRELTILRQFDHPNVVKLLYFFYTHEQNSEFLNLILEYVPDTVYRIYRSFHKSQHSMPAILVKVIMYQVFRSLAYIHSMGICHRDIKPHNLLIDTNTYAVKICDFGSAKPLTNGESNVSYICSRYYRAPELIFGSTNYTNSVDIWSAGCVFGEIVLGHALFAGENGVDQLVEIIKILGAPNHQQVVSMNRNFADFPFPHFPAKSLSVYLSGQLPADGLNLLVKVLEYSPDVRFSALQALAHSYFNDLRRKGCRLHDNKELPPLFNFNEQELRSIAPNFAEILIPAHAASASSSPSSATSTDDEYDRSIYEG